MINDCWKENYVEGCSRGLFQGTIPTFAWRDWRNPQRTSDIMVGVPANIRTWLLRKYSQKHYRLNQLSLFSVNTAFCIDTSRRDLAFLYSTAILVSSAASNGKWLFMNDELRMKVLRLNSIHCMSICLYLSNTKLGECTGLHWTIIQSNFTGQHSYVFLRTRAQTSAWRPATNTDDFRCLPQFLQANAGEIPQISPGPLPFTPFPADCSIIILSFDDIIGATGNVVQ